MVLVEEVERRYVSHDVFQSQENAFDLHKMNKKYVNTTCRHDSLTRRAGAEAVVGCHPDVVLTGTLQAGDRACEV